VIVFEEIAFDEPPGTQQASGEGRHGTKAGVLWAWPRALPRASFPPRSQTTEESVRQELAGREVMRSMAMFWRQFQEEVNI
jgi:hypothetical protein